MTTLQENMDKRLRAYFSAGVTTVEYLQRWFLSAVPNKEGNKHTQKLFSQTKEYLKKETAKAAQEILFDLEKMESNKDNFIQGFIEGIQDWVEGENPDIGSAEWLANTLKIKWNVDRYRTYASFYSEEKFLNKIYEIGENPELMGMISGIHSEITILQDLQSLLKQGKDIPDIYIDTGSGREFIQTNINDLENLQQTVFNDLLYEYSKALESSFDKQLYIESEINEFHRLFRSGEKGWEYLADRMKMSEEEIEEIHRDRVAVILGKHVITFYSYNREQRLNYAILIAITKYINYLKEESNIGNNGQSLNKSLSNIDPWTPNLSLEKNYRKNIEEAYKLLAGEFILSNLDTFQGILIPGTYKGKVRLSEPTTVAEIRYLINGLTNILGCSDIWVCAANCFENTNGSTFTRQSFANPKYDPTRKTEIEEIIKIIKAK